MNCDPTISDFSRTADELYRRMEETHFGAEDAYWSSLPVHLRNFIKNALPMAGNISMSGGGSGILPGGVYGAGGQRSMYTMAQNIFSAANRSVGSVTAGTSHYVSAPLAKVDAVRALSPTESITNNLPAVTASNPPDVRQTGHRYRRSQVYELGQTPYPTGGEEGRNDSQISADHVNPSDRPLSPLQEQQTSRVPAVIGSSPGSHSPRTSYPQNPSANRQTSQTSVPPSSRAAGKQPMQSGGPQSPLKNTAQQAAPVPPSTRSARSAGKAPVASIAGNGQQVPPMASSPAVQSKGATNALKTKNANPSPIPVRVWQTSTAEERERIKAFWRDLGAEERKRLIRLEKEAISKRMKDHQRHACSCAVCARKRIAIESELEISYEAYAMELNVFDLREKGHQLLAEHELNHTGGPGPFPGSVEVDPSGNIIKPDYLAPAQYAEKTINEANIDSDEEYEEDDEYEDDEDDDIEEDDDIGSNDADQMDDDYEGFDRRSTKPIPRNPNDPARTIRSHSGQHTNASETETMDFLSFRGDLASIKGVLTVADDLLKNDGQRFLEMMEQLAERRSNRLNPSLMVDQDAHSLAMTEIEAASNNEDLDSESEGLFPNRAEEGRRMFQIFAARIFEQRVLQAYREQVAQQKQLQFLKELEEEENAAEAKEARKAKDAQKKKDKRRLQKQAKEDEKARKDAAMAAEAELLRLKQAHAEKEAMRRREDEKAKREAEKKAKAEEQLRKEEERRRRQEREREIEKARKQRDRDEKAKSLLASAEDKSGRLNSSAVPPTPLRTSESAIMDVRSNVSPPPLQQKTQIELSTTPKVTHTSSLLEDGRQSQPNAASSGFPRLGSCTTTVVMRNPISTDDVVPEPLRSSAQTLSDRKATSPVAASLLHSTKAAFSPDSETAITIEAADSTDRLRGVIGHARAVVSSDISRARSQAIDPAMTVNGAISSSNMVTTSSVDYSRGPEPDLQTGNLLASGRTSRPQTDGLYSANYSDGNSIALRLSGTSAAPMPLPQETHILRSPGPIGPIQPIGRPRPTLSAGPTELHVEASAKPPSIRKSSPPANGRTLGSAALSSGDDDVIIPAPRRVSHSTGVLGQSWNSSPAGIPSSHWSSTFAVSPTPIWGHTNLPQAGGNAWPSAPHPTPFFQPRYDVSAAGSSASDLFTSRCPANVGGMTNPMQPPSARHHG